MYFVIIRCFPVQKRAKKTLKLHRKDLSLVERRAQKHPNVSLFKGCVISFKMLRFQCTVLEMHFIPLATKMHININFLMIQSNEWKSATMNNWEKTTIAIGILVLFIIIGLAVGLILCSTTSCIDKFN